MSNQARGGSIPPYALSWEIQEGIDNMEDSVDSSVAMLNYIAEHGIRVIGDNSSNDMDVLWIVAPSPVSADEMRFMIEYANRYSRDSTVHSEGSEIMIKAIKMK